MPGLKSGARAVALTSTDFSWSVAYSRTSRLDSSPEQRRPLRQQTTPNSPPRTQTSPDRASTFRLRTLLPPWRPPPRRSSLASRACTQATRTTRRIFQPHTECTPRCQSRSRVGPRDMPPGAPREACRRSILADCFDQLSVISLGHKAAPGFEAPPTAQRYVSHRLNRPNPRDWGRDCIKSLKV